MVSPFLPFFHTCWIRARLSTTGKYAYTLQAIKQIWVNLSVVAQERLASNQKVAKLWFDSQSGSASLYPRERHLMLFLSWPKQFTSFGGPAWRKTFKQNSFCVGMVLQTQRIQHLVQTKNESIYLCTLIRKLSATSTVWIKTKTENNADLKQMFGLSPQLCDFQLQFFVRRLWFYMNKPVFYVGFDFTKNFLKD